MFYKKNEGYLNSIIEISRRLLEYRYALLSLLGNEGKLLLGASEEFRKLIDLKYQVKFDAFTRKLG